MYPTHQLALPMLTHYSGPRLRPSHEIGELRTYRDAVRWCWFKRTRGENLTQSQAASEVDGMRASHLSEYLSPNPDARDMPARFIKEFEESMGNRTITQWITHSAGLHHLEQLIEQQRMAA